MTELVAVLPQVLRAVGEVDGDAERAQRFGRPVLGQK